MNPNTDLINEIDSRWTWRLTESLPEKTFGYFITIGAKITSIIQIIGVSRRFEEKS